MGDNLFNVSLASAIITASYQRLIGLDYANMSDTLEYQELVTKIKKYVKVENEAYDNLTTHDIDSYFRLVSNNTRFAGIADARVYSRMNNLKRIRDNNPMVDGTLLSSVISSKLTIDILKNVDAGIHKLQANDSLDDTDITLLELYNKRYKYYYLTSNSFIEKLSLDCNFDIDILPSYTYRDIERKYGLNFVDNIQNNFYSYVLEALNNLMIVETHDRYVVLYSSLFEIARIEAILPYLSIDSLSNILHYINLHITKYDSNSALRKARKIIIKKKEELER